MLQMESVSSVIYPFQGYGVNPNADIAKIYLT